MSVHVPIMVAPIVQGLCEPLEAGGIYSAGWIADCTFGGGGHTRAILERLASRAETRQHRVIALDQDADAVAHGRERFRSEIAEGRLDLVHSEFGAADEVFRARLGDRPLYGLLADLGISSDQLDSRERGFGFESEGLVDMRMDTSRGEPLHARLKHAREDEIETALREYGEERFSRRVAQSIVRARMDGEAFTTDVLKRAIVRGMPPHSRHGRIHAATRSFQGLRIWINGELEQLDRLLDSAILSVTPGGRVAILSFHSLEDRRVKRALWSRPELFSPLTKKPVEADQTEVVANPRSRSAKLRIAERAGQQARGV